MGNTVLFENADHKSVLLEDFNTGTLAVQANQHLIIHGKEAMILDPGGHKVYNRVFSETMNQIGSGTLRYLFLSHQDPDIVAAVNGWLMTTDAGAWCSGLWARFIPHFGLDHLVAERLGEIPDGGMFLDLGGVDMMVVPAHFLHSCGNHHLYDPVSKILYTGDLGASIGADYLEVEDFDDHIQYMEGFHRRYMASKRALEGWAEMVGGLDIETIAPQHGALFKGPEMSQRFIAWVRGLECGLDTMKYTLPTKG